jgi:diacylglycerol kinase family enzyme
VPKSRKAPKQVKRALAEGAELVFAWGGDGTVQRCIDVLAGTGTPLAIIPAGTANLLATNLGIPGSIEEAVATGLHGARRTIDVGRLNGERFAVMAGAGLDAAMIRDADAGSSRTASAASPTSGRAPATSRRSRSRRRSASTVPRGSTTGRAPSSSATSAACSGASRRSTTPSPTTACSSSAS